MPRRTKAEMSVIKYAIIDFATNEGPVTVRQTFYRLVVLGLIEKDENEYRETVSRLMTEMREAGELDWSLVEDGSRFKRGPDLWESAAEYQKAMAANYRRNVWSNQPVAVEVWLEKEALASIVLDVTWEYGVPLFVAKGFSSATYVHDAAERIDNRDRDTVLLYFGDHDPAGVTMDADLGRRLARYTTKCHADGSERFTVVRCGLNPSQIAHYGLPSRPTKRNAQDYNAKNFAGDSTELDALNPSDLRDLVEQAIVTRLDVSAYDADRLAEESEVAILTSIAESMK